MAHIVSFAVSGLVGRSGVYEQQLNRDVNVFFGVNGSGKTSLLKILHGALANDASGLANVAFTAAEGRLYSVNTDQEFLRLISRAPVKPPSQAVTLFGDAVEMPSTTPSPPLQWITAANPAKKQP